KVLVPFSQRKWDALHIVTFLMFLGIAFTIDIIAGTAPTGHRLPNGTNVWGVSLENAGRWPPRFFYESTLAYCKFADQVFCHNPMWMKVIIPGLLSCLFNPHCQVMALWSPVFYGPFYCFAIYAFVRGRDWIRVPALMWAWGMA